jgi:hypothetical protein
VAGCVVVFKTILQLFSKQVRELNILDPGDGVDVVEGFGGVMAAQ